MYLQGSGRQESDSSTVDRSRELRDQREKDRHLRSSTTRALAGTATGARLKDPIGAMAPSPVGNVGKFTVCSAQGKSPIRMIRMILGGGGGGGILKLN